MSAFVPTGSDGVGARAGLFSDFYAVVAGAGGAVWNSSDDWTTPCTARATSSICGWQLGSSGSRSNAAESRARAVELVGVQHKIVRARTEMLTTKAKARLRVSPIAAASTGTPLRAGSKFEQDVLGRAVTMPAPGHRVPVRAVLAKALCAHLARSPRDLRHRSASSASPA